jgi:drug/metabolite transporter (DMT)-like permease
LLLMLATGLITEGLPSISLQSWGILLLLAVVNTAFSFTVWNYTLQTLSAMESSIINSTMMIQVAILAWIFLGERVDLRGGIGLMLVAAGTLIVQLHFPGKKQLVEA